MVTIRLRRTGMRKEPHFRLVVSDSRKDTVGTYLEMLGYYNPRTTPATVKLNEERIKHWLANGAQASGTVHNLLVDAKILSGPKRAVGNRKKVEAAPATETKAAPAAAEALKAK